MTPNTSNDLDVCRHGHIGRYVLVGKAKKLRCLDCRREQIRRSSAKHLLMPSRKKYVQEKQKEHRINNPLKSQARRKLQRAVFNGYIIKPSCERCANKSAEAHHYDYNRAFDVLWLCKSCHEWLHHTKVLEVI